MREGSFDRPTEFEVQSVAFSTLRGKFPYVRGEYKYKHPLKRGARFDIAIFDSNKALKLIIEVKKSKKNPNRKTATKQLDHYKDITNVPVMHIRGMDEAYRAKELVDDFLKASNLVI